MIWAVLPKLLTGALLAWFAGLVIVIALRMIRGEIATAGLFSGTPGQPMDLHRAQLLGAIALFAGGYIVHALRLPPGSPLPDISPVILTMLIGSQSVYLVGKYLQS